MDSFFYFIEDEESNALVLKQIKYQYSTPNPSQQQKELELQRILMSEKLLQLPYAQVHICYSSTNFTLLPESLFSKHQMKDYLKQVTRVDDTQVVGSCQLAKLGIRIVYSVDKVVEDAVKSYFPGARHMHIAAPLVMQSYHQCNQNQSKQLCLHVGNKIMGLILFDQDKLQLINTYPYHSEHDFMYYTMMVFEQFKLDPATVPIYITGRSKKKTPIYDQMSKYVNSINFIHPPSHYQYSVYFEQVDLHFYCDLLSMKLCV